MTQFKVLLVYPNLMLVSTLPNNIALLSACLKKANCSVKVFDSTLYKTEEKSNDEKRVERLQVRSFNIKESGISLERKDVITDFRKCVKDFEPDLIGVTVVDDTMKLALALIESVKDKQIPTIFGGVNAFFNAEFLIGKDFIDYVCIGEGEEALVELCQCLKNDCSPNHIKNLWIKRDGRVIKNSMRPPVEINQLPYDDFSVFESKRLYRPMQGRMLSMLPINIDRGCPYQCTFCNAPVINELYKNENFRYFRKKDIRRIHEEINYYVKRYKVEYLYLNSETFLSMPLTQLKEFAQVYSSFRLPFWCQARIETVTEKKIEILKEMNCDRLSIGIEHGNEEFRKKILNKHYSNQSVIRAFEILEASGLNTSVNNVIGFPDETRELIFDTINLNRKVKSDSVNGFVFQPYSGTKLRQYCIEKGYISVDSQVGFDDRGTPIGSSMLDMPSISKAEIEGLLRTFVLYVRMPKSYYPKIEIAEQLNDEGDQALSELKEIFFRDFF